MPPDQQNNQNYYQYGVFWLYNWFQAENNNMNIFFINEWKHIQLFTRFRTIFL